MVAGASSAFHRAIRKARTKRQAKVSHRVFGVSNEDHTADFLIKLDFA